MSILDDLTAAAGRFVPRQCLTVAAKPRELALQEREVSTDKNARGNKSNCLNKLTLDDHWIPSDYRFRISALGNWGVLHLCHLVHNLIVHTN